MLKKSKGLLNKKYDTGLLLTSIALLIIGVILVFSASWPEGITKYENGYYFIKKHLRFILLGTFVLVFCMNFDYRYYRKLNGIIILVMVVTYGLLFTKFGDDRLGSVRWVNLGPISFMPSDIVKIGSVFVLANFLVTNKRNQKDFTRGTLATALVIAVPFLAIVVKDLGSAAVLGVALLVMAIVDGMKLSHLPPLAGMAALLLAFALQSDRFAYRLVRIRGFMDPFADMSGTGWQLGNSLLSLALGGFTGVGLGMGIQKNTYIPHVYNDFIFSVAGEEFGFIGAGFIIVLFMIFMWRGFLIASNCKDRYGKLVAVGMTMIIVVQAMFHIMVVIGAAPVTGITLPLISYGGTSLIINMACVGVLLNISKKR